MIMDFAIVGKWETFPPENIHTFPVSISPHLELTFSWSASTQKSKNNYSINNEVQRRNFSESTRNIFHIFQTFYSNLYSSHHEPVQKKLFISK